MRTMDSKLYLNMRLSNDTDVTIDYAGAGDAIDALKRAVESVARLEGGYPLVLSDDLPIMDKLAPGDDCALTLHTTANTTIESVLEHIKDGSLDIKMGDSLSCALKNGQRVTLVATEVTDDAIRFEMKELLKCVPHDDVNAWYGELLTQFPDVLRDAIIPTVRRYRMNGDGEMVKFTTKLFMPSASEVFSDAEYEKYPWLGDKGVYAQMEYYKIPINRIRCTIDDGLSNDWWLLSANSGNSTNFAVVNSNGGASYHSATYAWIAAPVCFRIRKSL